MFEGEEYCGFYKEVERTARKQHKCCACNELIQPKQKYWNIKIQGEGTVWTLKRCQRCQTLHVHLRGKAAIGEGVCDFLDCEHSYEELYGECPEHIQALAFKLPGELTTTAKTEGDGE